LPLMMFFPKVIMAREFALTEDQSPSPGSFGTTDNGHSSPNTTSRSRIRQNAGFCAARNPHSGECGYKMRDQRGVSNNVVEFRFVVRLQSAPRKSRSDVVEG